MVPNRAKQFTNTELFHRFIKTVNPWNQSVSKYYWPEGYKIFLELYIDTVYFH